MSEYFLTANGIFGKDGKPLEDKTFLLWSFPDQKTLIGRLSLDQKMQWYAHQFQNHPRIYPAELTSEAFKRFWKWQVLVPIKIKRFFYRVKNGEIFKRYQHISEMKSKVKKHGI